MKETEVEIQLVPWSVIAAMKEEGINREENTF